MITISYNFYELEDLNYILNFISLERNFSIKHLQLTHEMVISSENYQLTKVTFRSKHQDIKYLRTQLSDSDDELNNKDMKFIYYNYFFIYM